MNAHVEATRRAYEWAEKALAYRVAGKREQAARAEQKARHWLRKVMALESKANGADKPV